MNEQRKQSGSLASEGQAGSYPVKTRGGSRASDFRVEYAWNSGRFAMMAVVLHEYGGPEQLKFEDNVPEPQVSGNRVLIAVAAASVNPIDWKLRSGMMQKNFPLTFPAILGRDVSDIVRAVGANVKHFKAGDRVLALSNRTYDELVAVDDSEVTHLPDGVDLADAAAIPLISLTGDQLVRLATNVTKGQFVLITGALGSVGRAAVHTAKKIIEPFPEPLAPHGYIMVEVPVVQPEITLQYLIFDFGKREGKVGEAAAQKIAAGANFIAANQQVAFRVASAYYGLLTAQERLEAARQTLKTAQTTQDAAEDRMNNGRATLPDVLNARAETAQSVFDLESADGDEKIARVTLTEVVGADSSPRIQIDGTHDKPLPQQLILSIDSLIERAMKNRPDLQAQSAEIRATDNAIRQAKAAYLPQIGLTAAGAQTSLWPTADSGELGAASEPTWSVALSMEWRLWDGGSRKGELEIAKSRRREAQDEMTDMKDQATSEVWTAYISFRSAVRKEVFV
jgi:hypothetical protein